MHCFLSLTKSQQPTRHVIKAQIMIALDISPLHCLSHIGHAVQSTSTMHGMIPEVNPLTLAAAIPGEAGDRVLQAAKFTPILYIA